MADVKYAVVTRARMRSESVGVDRIAVKIEKDLENGCIVKVGSLVGGEREVYSTSVPAADTAVENIAILTSPEVVADERKKNKSDFINPSGIPATADKLYPGDIFGLTAEGFDGDPVVGSVVELQADYKLKVEAAPTGSSTVVGKIVDVYNNEYGVRVGEE